MNAGVNSEYARQRKRELRRNTKLVCLYIILIFVAIIMLYPIVWLVGASFKSNADIFTSIGFIPKSLDFTPYIQGWKTATEFTMGHYFLNTFKIVIPKAIFVVISATLTAYGFARFNFPYKKLFFAILIGTLLLPNIILRIPSYMMWKTFGMLDTYVPLVLPSLFATDVFFVFMLVQFFRGIPKDLDESAKIDGCSSLKTLIYILVPVLKPAIISCGLFTFLWTMNDFMGPLIFISSVEKYPLTIALKMSMDATGGSFDWNKIIAMSLLGLLPSILVFFSAQKYFIEGISSSGIKG
ncbi:carbohydrate ABC transporter permease [Cellulosilyticum sp. I15G10I2]|uniref:carbohydrate ABC transporter permease n=1 Tax=Cellulosilyticum sp. I15G10I2 TaxID=1892843 RepID=UPI00085CD257|nr:carbohydrate ABC transporter permease [Cellulosilyticum sp. I15G10I2]